MRTRTCWSLCGVSAAAAALLGGGRGFAPFIAADSLSAVVAAVALTTLWNLIDRREDVLLRAAYASLGGGALATAINVSVTLAREPDAALVPMRLALGLTGLLYGAAAAGVILAVARRSAQARPAC